MSSMEMEEQIAALEIKVDQLEQQVATHEAALWTAGEFVRKVGEAAIEANKPTE